MSTIDFIDFVKHIKPCYGALFLRRWVHRCTAYDVPNIIRSFCTQSPCEVCNRVSVCNNICVVYDTKVVLCKQCQYVREDTSLSTSNREQFVDAITQIRILTTCIHREIADIFALFAVGKSDVRCTKDTCDSCSSTFACTLYNINHSELLLCDPCSLSILSIANTMVTKMALIHDISCGIIADIRPLLCQYVIAVGL